MGTDYLSMYGYNTNFKTVEEVADTMTDVILELEGAWGHIKDIIEEENSGFDDDNKKSFSDYTQEKKSYYRNVLSVVSSIDSDTELEEGQRYVYSALPTLQEAENMFFLYMKTYNEENDAEDIIDEIFHILSSIEGLHWCLEELVDIQLDDEDY